MNAERSEYLVAPTDHRLRLDRFVTRTCPQLSRRAIDRLLRTGGVLVSGRPRGRRYFVKQGERVTICLPDEPASQPADPPRILYQGNGLIAVAKPPGLPTVPPPRSAGKARPSLLAWLEQEAHLAHRPGVVHRLDRETSGLVLFSLAPQLHRRIVRAFRERTLRKAYFALCDGRPSSRRGRIELPLMRDASGRVRPHQSGKPARTDYRCLETGPNWSLLLCAPRTGRTHQIRVHLAASGLPVAGDPDYGAPSSTLTVPRLWLHARSLMMPDRIAAQAALPRKLTCPLWHDLAAHLRSMRGAGHLPGPCTR